MSGENNYFKTYENYNDPEILKNVIKRYVNNKNIIETVGNKFNIQTLFVWQPVPTYNYDLKYHKFAKAGFGRFNYSKYGYPEMAEFVKKNNLRENFLWLADIQESIKEPLYVDIDHYSDKMSKMIAKEIVDHYLALSLKK